MIRTWSAAALILISSTASAGWTKAYSIKDGEMYVDNSTIRSKGKMRQIWMLVDYKEICRTEDCVQSMKVLYEYDCQAETGRINYLISYSGHMGAGETIGQINAQKLGEEGGGEHRPMAPGTHGSDELRRVCVVENLKLKGK